MNSPVRTVWRVSAAMALILALGIGLTGNSEAKHRADWFSAWGTSQQGLAAETVSDGTVRMIVRPTLSGTFVRVQLQNTFGTAPLTIGAAAIGARVNGAGLAPGSNRPLTFNGSPSVTIPAGGVVSNDPLAFAVHAWQDLAVSLYIPGTAAPISRHTNARKTSFWTLAGAGNHAADEAATAFAQTTTSMWWVAALDVFSSTADGTIVFFGDSITDGTATTTDGHDRWHDIVALRLMLDSKAKVELGTVNEGIGGNRVTVTATQGSPAAVERLDRDVLARAGVSHVVFFEGTNDLASGLVNAEQLIAGMQNIIGRVHARGLPIIAVTIIPRHNATWTPQMTEYRHVVNDWIRHRANFEAVIDFDVVMRDPANPDLMNPLLDFADHVHPNPFGYFTMGRAVDLSLFERPLHRR